MTTVPPGLTTRAASCTTRLGSGTWLTSVCANTKSKTRSDRRSSCASPTSHSMPPENPFCSAKLLPLSTKSALISIAVTLPRKSGLRRTSLTSTPVPQPRTRTSWAAARSIASRYSWSMPMYLALPRRASSRVAIVSIDFASSSSVRPYTSTNGITDSLQLSPTAVIGTHSQNGTLWHIRPRSRRSLRLDAREPHHLGPLLGFRGDEVAKVGGRARNHCTAQIGEPCLKLGMGEGGVDLVVELVDDFGRRIPRRADAAEGACLIARHEIVHGRDVR